MTRKGRTYQAASVGDSLPQETDEIRPFFYNALRAVTGSNYLTRRWLPREGPLFVAFILVLRDQCFYNAQTGEIRNTCYPEVGTLAAKCGVSRRTLFRLLERDDEGHFLNESLGRFIKIIKRRRYDLELQREVQTSNLYLVAMDDPTVPEDDDLLAQKEAEFAALQALAAAEADKRIQRRSECHFGTQTTVPKWHPESSAKMALETSTLIKRSPLRRGIDRKTPPSPDDFSRETEETDGGEWFSTALEALDSRNEVEEAETETNKEQKRTRRRVRRKRLPRTQKGKLSDEAEEAYVPVGEPPDSTSSRHIAIAETSPPRRGLRTRDAPYTQAKEEVGGVIANILHELGDTNTEVGVQIIVQAFVDAGAPEGVLVPLAYVGRERLRRFRQRGGQIGVKARYYTTLMRNLAYEAACTDWNIESLEPLQ